MRLLPTRYFGRATGQHRARPAGAIVDQDFAHCARCKTTVPVTVHGDLLVCAEGHLVEEVA